MNTTETESDIVCMARPIADKLDYSMGPMDGLVAIGQVHQDLAIIHNRHSPRHWYRRRNSLRIFRARMDWAGVGLDYLEYGGHLHVVGIWHFSLNDRSLPKVDCVFPEPEDFDRYVVEGVSAA